MAGGAWWASPLGVHPCLEVVPALTGNPELSLRHAACVFAEHVQEHDQIPRAAVDHPVELRPVVAAQLPQLAFELRAPREGLRRIVRAQQVQALDLVVERRLLDRVAECLDEVVDRLRAVRRPVVDRACIPATRSLYERRPTGLLLQTSPAP